MKATSKKVKSKRRSLESWQMLAQRRLAKILNAIQLYPRLRKSGPQSVWFAEVKLVGNSVMTQLNFNYRKKRYPTDVLSFPTNSPFRETGFLGELVICLPTLKKQAKELHHSADQELNVLLIHGLLHLLGLDHEKNSEEATRMARWEARVLSKLANSRSKKKVQGLIHRAKA
jgi:rRNA maturation RNase YbeY